jgi:hypothetical protein
MSPLLVLFLTVAPAIAGLRLHDLQTSLERWDYKRHTQD